MPLLLLGVRCRTYGGTNGAEESDDDDGGGPSLLAVAEGGNDTVDQDIALFAEEGG